MYGREWADLMIAFVDGGEASPSNIAHHNVRFYFVIFSFPVPVEC